MGKPLRVKAKKAWSKVEIPDDILNSEAFDGLIDFQELTDYELVEFDEAGSTDNESESKVSKTLKKKKKAKKRKGDKNDAADDADMCEPTNKKLKQDLSTKSETTSKKKKKKKVKSKQNQEDEKVKDLPEEDHQRGALVENVNVVDVYDEIDLDSHGNEQSQVTNKSKTKEKKEKKEKKKPKKKNKDKKVSEKSCAQDTKDVAIDDSPSNDEEKSVKKDELDMSEWANLHVPPPVLQALTELRFSKPTAIQTQALPAAIRDRRDILGAAETGSGKTFAFGIPILARILAIKEKQRAETAEAQEEMDTDAKEDDEEEDTDVPIENKPKKTEADNPPLALILEPTRELAVQVMKHLKKIAVHTDIQFALVVGGMAVEKQRRLLARRPEVIIATPGRLWQLIEQEGNSHLRGVDRAAVLVLDEADRMVERGHYAELQSLLEMINTSERKEKNRQTFVMSATLTMDISAPKRLNGKKKKKKEEEDKMKNLTDNICTGFKPKVIDLTPKDKVAQTLTELRINCKADEKDWYLYYFLCVHPGRTLVFVNSKDCLRRLAALLGLLQVNPLPLHADMHQKQRLKNLDKFADDPRGLLVASDVAARGLDIPKVDHVVHYQVPRTMENYVHRAGRTARAATEGLSVMLVAPEEARDYRKIVQGVRNGEDLEPLPIDGDMIPAARQRVSLARDLDVQEYRIKKKKVKNNFFTKAAMEMDMIIDDPKLLEELGDAEEQSDQQQRLRGMKEQLKAMLKGSLAPLRMTKYPTKMGTLQAPHRPKLHKTR